MLRVLVAFWKTFLTPLTPTYHQICILFWLSFRSVILLAISKLDFQLSNKIIFIWLNENPSKIMKSAFYFIWKARFALKILEFLSWLFGYVETMAWLERYQNLLRHNLVNKELQCTYFSISHKIKATTHWNLVR